MSTHKDMKRAYNDPKRCRDMWAKWYAANKDTVNARKRGKWPAHPRPITPAPVLRERAAIKSRINKYGVTADDYAKLLVAQGGLCAICRQPETVVSRYTHRVRTLSVDHCHTTHRVRGLLCARCNSAIGLARENADVCRAMAVYLESCNAAA
jgi:hypothetical protein